MPTRDDMTRVLEEGLSIEGTPPYVKHWDRIANLKGWLEKCIDLSKGVISLWGTFDVCHQCAANYRRHGEVSLWRMLGLGHTSEDADLYFQICDFFFKHFGTSGEADLIDQLQLCFPLPGHGHNVADNAICKLQRQTWSQRR